MTVLPEALLYIDGKLHPAQGGRTFPNVSPWSNEVIGYAADADASDIEEAIASARRAFDKTDWSRDKDLRVELVTRLRDLMRANRDRIAEILRHEAGATLGSLRVPHLDWGLDGFDDLLRQFPEVTWQQSRGRRNEWGFTSERLVVREAIGVVGAITPWNAPVFVNIAKLVSALLAGCTVILKPAPDTPHSGAIFGELAAQAGFPAGVLNVLTASDPVEAGETLVTDPRVDLISFTGSTGVGKRIMEKSAQTLTRVFLELGGKSAKIVLEDDPNFIASVKNSLLTTNAGQGCASLSRLLVPRNRYAEATEALKEAVADYETRWGEFDNPTHTMGPVINQKQRDRILDFIRIGQEEGATLLAGGKARPDKGNGWFIEQTVFTDVTNDMRIAQEEIFGPVLVVIPFEDDEDAIRIANDSEFGLSGGVSSGDEARALRIAHRMRTGTVGVNGGMCITSDLPFGGYKVSGIGREWGVEGIEEYLETKVISIKR
ncbi:MAG TPA: aldehyde dehydrogenase family protein [Novosphingobium sp.]